MATIYVDGKAYQASPDDNLLRAGLGLGLDIPFFCWHPALGSVGACRLCAVKQFRDEQDTRGRIVMSCMTPAADGTRISVADPEAKAFRASVIEWLMVNHPHDCPVCDEGGECHLQDMTLMSGHVYRRARVKKRTFRNQYLGPFLNHEMNRCIECYRCVRFYRDYAGGRDLNVFAAHDIVYFGRYEDGVLESEFSGNLAEVCPTGVFTDKTLKRHYTRKWDLQMAPSICAHCGLGCNTSPGERYGTLRRIINRYHHRVNGYFLCDRGRFGYEFVNDPDRIRTALVRSGPTEPARPVEREEALAAAASMLRGKRILGIGSPRASLEANFALREMVGAERFSIGVSEREQRLLALCLEILRGGWARSASLLDVERSDAVLVLGEDVTNTAPRAALSLRQAARRAPLAIAEGFKIPEWHDYAVRYAVQEETSPFTIASPHPTRLDDVATRTFRLPPDEIARLGFAVAHAIDPASPAPPELPEELTAAARAIARELGEATKPVVVSGTGSRSEAVLRAAANVARALRARKPDSSLCLAVPECNSMGVALLGGMSLEEAFGSAQRGEVDAVIVLENDLYRRSEPAAVAAFLDRAGRLIVLDSISGRTTERADVLFPAGTFAESDGSWVSSEGRAQRFYQVYPPEEDIRESWRWLRDLMNIAAGEARSWSGLDDVIAALGRALPALAGVADAAPAADFRIAGQKIPREPHRYSGRTAMRAHRDVHEPKPASDPDSALAFSMEGYHGQPPSALVPFFWAPGWNSHQQAMNKYQREIGGVLRGGDAGVRLLDDSEPDRSRFFEEIPAPFRREEGSWLAVPIHHIFGSEELSRRAPAIAERAPAEAYLALSPDEAGGLGVGPGEIVEAALGALRFRLPVRLLPSLAPGLAGIPAGLPGVEALPLPAWISLSKVSR